MKRPELLAPAGGTAALHAAVMNGADAVYLGLPAFNARRSADNFTLESFEEACAYAHGRGVRVYVTMNTVVLPGEMADALELARRAWLAGADAFIVQDLGLAEALRRALPEARLHCSTQMNIHNAAGLRAAARLGAERVTLARELSIDEVAALAAEAQALGMEVESFVHGALCVCYSGQCFMSSMIGGRSANRGACAQACRLPYELACEGEALPAEGEHLLSPADLCAVDRLADLVQASVASFKVEGRMKSPEYVGAVVGVYRRVLDQVLAEGTAQATADERTTLASVFSRGFTTAYLEGERGNAMMSYQRPNNRGMFAGRVREVCDGLAMVALEQPLEPGDLIEFWTRKGHARMEVAAPVAARDPEAFLVLPDDLRGVRSQDRIFKVRSAAVAFKDEPNEPRIPVVGRATVRQGQPLEVAFAVAAPDELPPDDAVGRAIAARLAAAGNGSLKASAQGSVVEAARTCAVTAGDIAEHVGRMGATAFRLVSFQAQVGEGAGVGFSQVHRVRAEALDQLMAAIQAPAAGRQAAKPPKQKAAGQRHHAASAAPASEPLLAVLATNPACARAAKRAGAAAVYVPALNYLRGEAQYAGLLSDQPEQAGYPKGCALAMPEVDHDPVGCAREARVGADAWEHAAAHEPLLAEGIGAMQRAAEAGLAFEVGSHIPATNAEALQALAGWGAQRAWLSPELNLHQIEELGAASTLPLGIVIMGRQVLMTMEHCALMSQGPCDQRCDRCLRRRKHHTLRDRKGFEFPVVTDALGRSRIYNSVALDVAHAASDLWRAGVGAFMVDSTLMVPEETAQAVGRARQALDAACSGADPVPKRKGATTGHLFRGIE